MIEKYNMLHGEFIEFIWKTLFEYKDETEKKEFWDRIIQYIFILMRIIEEQESV